MMCILYQDHKAVGNGDTGPNTGGMGTYSPAPIVTDAVFKQTMDEIMWRTAKAMVAEGASFKGTLFAGLMIKDGKVGGGIACHQVHLTLINSSLVHSKYGKITG
jgi:phosphoribosylamine-glycine ligase